MDQVDLLIQLVLADLDCQDFLESQMGQYHQIDLLIQQVLDFQMGLAIPFHPWDP